MLSRASAFVASLAVLAGSTAVAQSDRLPDAPASPAQPPATQPMTLLSKADLEEMLSPIALYPDTLLANVLAACCYPQDVQAAAAHVAAGKSLQAAPAPEWEPSVRAVAAFPAAIRLLGDNMAWTTGLGQAYLAQGKDVMAAVQSLRTKAWNNGALKSGAQQTVVREGSTIIIESAQPEVVYVPTYNPSVVYVEEDHDDEWAAAAIGFGVGIMVGAIISDVHCDWHGGCVGWGHGWGNTNIHNDIDINIDNSFNGRQPGREGQRWQPNQAKTTRQGTAQPTSLGQFKGAGASSPGARAAIPGRQGATKSIARNTGATAPKARPATTTARPSAPTPRPAGTTSSVRPAAPQTPRAPVTPKSPTAPKAPAAAPRAPAAAPRAPTAAPQSPANRSTPSGFRPSGGGGRGGGGRRGR